MKGRLSQEALIKSCHIEKLRELKHSFCILIFKMANSQVFKYGPFIDTASLYGEQLLGRGNPSCLLACCQADTSQCHFADVFQCRAQREQVRRDLYRENVTDVSSHLVLCAIGLLVRT